MGGWEGGVNVSVMVLQGRKSYDRLRVGVVTGVEIKWLLDSWRFFQMSFFPNLLIIKKSPSRIALSPLLLSVTRYLSSSHVRPIVSLQYSLLWKKVDAKWFYSIASSRPYSSFTKADMNT